MPYRVVVLLAAAIALVGCGDDNGNGAASKQPQARPEPKSRAATVQQLKALAREVGHDVFWAGARRGFTYELTHTTAGNIFIRYLPPGVPTGAGSPDFLSVGSYPQEDAFATIEEARKKPNEIVRSLGDGGVAVASGDRPTSVYFAYPGSKVLVEVYDPDADRAMRLARSGRIRPIR